MNKIINFHETEGAARTNFAPGHEELKQVLKRKEVGAGLAFTQIGENSTLTALKPGTKSFLIILRSRYISCALTRCTGPAGNQQTDLLGKNRRCLPVTLFYPRT